jgi:sugar/nucleoside kinase (ribokinase family)
LTKVKFGAARESNFSYHLFCIEQKIRREPLSWRVLKKAKALGLQTSIDINFSERIWPDREEAKEVLKLFVNGSICQTQ